VENISSFKILNYCPRQLWPFAKSHIQRPKCLYSQNCVQSASKYLSWNEVQHWRRE